MNGYENENNWGMRNYTYIYNRCIKSGHRIVVISVRESQVLMVCLDCDEVYKIKLGKSSSVHSTTSGDIRSSGLKSWINRIRVIFKIKEMKS